ncbi:hypothetical protein C7412_11571 [Paraburkholderia silvatlantica]|nr:hypothetical protein C7412_11571 [Paraburkholderia silvatlantica]
MAAQSPGKSGCLRADAVLLRICDPLHELPLPANDGLTVDLPTNGSPEREPVTGMPTIVEDAAKPASRAKTTGDKHRSICRFDDGDPTVLIEGKRDRRWRTRRSARHGEEPVAGDVPLKLTVAQDRIRRPDNFRQISHHLASIKGRAGWRSHDRQTAERRHAKPPRSMVERIFDAHETEQTRARNPRKTAFVRRDGLTGTVLCPRRVRAASQPTDLRQAHGWCAAGRLASEPLRQCADGFRKHFNCRRIEQVHDSVISCPPTRCGL